MDRLRIREYLNPLITNCMIIFSRKLQERLQNQRIVDNVKEIEILGLDEIFAYCKKLPILFMGCF